MGMTKQRQDARAVRALGGVKKNERNTTVWREGGGKIILAGLSGDINEASDSAKNICDESLTFQPCVSISVCLNRRPFMLDKADEDGKGSTVKYRGRLITRASAKTALLPCSTISTRLVNALQRIKRHQQKAHNILRRKAHIPRKAWPMKKRRTIVNLYQNTKEYRTDPNARKVDNGPTHDGLRSPHAQPSARGR